MATVTRVTLACDMCGDVGGVQTRTIGLDGTAYEIDLRPEDGKRLSQVAAGYMPKARKITAGRGRRHHGSRPGSRAGTAERALVRAMDGHCVASVVRQPADELGAVDVAFLVEAGQQDDMQRVVEDLARDWEGRIEVRLLGPIAAYDFTAATTPQG